MSSPNKPDGNEVQGPENVTKKNADKEETNEESGKNPSDGPGVENSDKPKTLEVHSANSWETADLGDSKRNDKFLRLMGAAKKEHHGRFVIGDHAPSHVRPRKDDEQLTEELTEQYQNSMEHRLAGGRKGHLGLGFHSDSETKSEKDEPSETNTADTTEEEKKDVRECDNKTDDEKSREKDERRRESSERKREGAEDDSLGEAKKMKFVKSSS